MDKKITITVIIAIFLALISAFLISRKTTTVTNPKKNIESTQEVFVEENSLKENTVEETEEVKSDENFVSPNKSVKSANYPVIKPMEKPIKIEEPTFDNVVIQEGSVVEEVEDYGVKKVGDTVEVTREFKLKSPTKYSFKDFGFLETVTK